MERMCVVCGKTIEITVNADKSYSGGHFFGEISKDGTGEYWECDDCYGRDWAE